LLGCQRNDAVCVIDVLLGVEIAIVTTMTTIMNDGDGGEMTTTMPGIVEVLLSCLPFFRWDRLVVTGTGVKGAVPLPSGV